MARVSIRFCLFSHAFVAAISAGERFGQIVERAGHGFDRGCDCRIRITTGTRSGNRSLSASSNSIPPISAISDR